MKVLAVAGSLRRASINAAFCRALVQLGPGRVIASEHPGRLPLFNPDLEAEPPAAVGDWRAAVQAADVLLLASPEYAHGISGVMKNALDWLVSFEGFVDKPVALVNTSPRAHHAYESLQEVLRTMNARLLRQSSISLPLLGGCVTETAMVADASVRAAMQGLLRTLDAELTGMADVGPSVQW
ncbi:NAD(P)H-dependent oxidoreductase [Mitsuaria sp. WAJ17]|uniref:NADPH-dependent FMN reductase n=1 Tax=Mitsuaria sp. WAJ17 TaxID=2761452 RepID=UPI001601B406|nr:NADPH-dependent FMN reductase [Mitsuaria sp. WAJ17]MBB2484101.1 NAD(P)H-dependent oxidoreductase [Mitsuaria sp. WAJ17]